MVLGQASLFSSPMSHSSGCSLLSSAPHPTPQHDMDNSSAFAASEVGGDAATFLLKAGAGGTTPSLDLDLEAPHTGLFNAASLALIVALAFYVYRLQRAGRIDLPQLARRCVEACTAAWRRAQRRRADSSVATSSSSSSSFERDKAPLAPAASSAASAGPSGTAADASSEESSVLLERAEGGSALLPTPHLLGLAPGETPLLSASDVRAVCQHLPSRCIGKDWQLLFSTDAHGYSLQTLYARVRHRGPTLLVVLDDEHHVVAGFASRDWSGSDIIGGSGGGGGGFSAASASHHFRSSQGVHDHTSSSFFGSGESFVASIRPSFRVFRWTRSNNLFLLARPDCLAFGGGGGGFGLSLDGALERGTSACSETYGNPPLTGGGGGGEANSAPAASSAAFRVIRVEVWGFVLNLTPVRHGASASSSSGGRGGGGGGSAHAGGTTKESLMAAAMSLKGRLFSHLAPSAGAPSNWAAGAAALASPDSGNMASAVVGEED